MGQSHVRRFIVLSLVCVALPLLADRAEPQGAGTFQPQSWRSPRHADPLPPPLVAGPFADEFIITGAEQGDPGETYAPAAGFGVAVGAPPIALSASSR